MKAAPLSFLPPESAGGDSTLSDDESPSEDLIGASAWDVATRYHEFKARASMQERQAALRRLSADAILERAREVLGSVVHPVQPRLSPWPDVPADAESVDLELEETLESAAAALSGKKTPLLAEDIFLSYQVHRHQPITLSIDTSLSMTGEKLALTAVALAVVMLQFPEDPIGIVAFENEARILKRPTERISVAQLVERFLDVPAQGYTHLEEGMKAALQLHRDAAGGGGFASRASTVLLTDGKYTAGRDPAYLAPRFPHLVVLKMGQERASLELCRELARKGKGSLREVGDLEVLPQVMYAVVKDLLRGRATR